MQEGFEFVCNCKSSDSLKIGRLERFGFQLSFGDARATPGYTAEENSEAGLVGVYTCE